MQIPPEMHGANPTAREARRVFLLRFRDPTQIRQMHGTERCRRRNYTRDLGRSAICRIGRCRNHGLSIWKRPPPLPPSPRIARPRSCLGKNAVDPKRASLLGESCGTSAHHRDRYLNLILLVPNIGTRSVAALLLGQWHMPSNWQTQTAPKLCKYEKKNKRTISETQHSQRLLKPGKSPQDTSLDKTPILRPQPGHGPELRTPKSEIKKSRSLSKHLRDRAAPP